MDAPWAVCVYDTNHLRGKLKGDVFGADMSSERCGCSGLLGCLMDVALAV